MTPAARTQAAIDLLDAIVAAANGGGAAADTLIARYFATRRYAGSKDRRAVRELVYAAVRALGEVPASGRAAMAAMAADDPMLAATFDGSAHGPAPLVPGEPIAHRGAIPDWLDAPLTRAGIDRGDRAALIARAPLDVRINTLVASREEMQSAIPDARPVAGLPDALRLPGGTDVARWAGAIEVQDAGSQAVTLAGGAQPGDTVVDLCAGAGGKTLALAALMQNRGRILATDTDRARLSRLAPRAARAGVTIADTRLLDPGRETAMLADHAAAADLVLVDAPCSGSGTWRRNPEARWRLTPARLARLVNEQARLLAVAAPLVRPGGALTLVVCSLLDEEGRDQADRFLAAHPGWSAATPSLPLGRARGAGVRLDPANDGTDGFFVARLRAPC